MINTALKKISSHVQVLRIAEIVKLFLITQLMLTGFPMKRKIEGEKGRERLSEYEIV